MPAMGLLIEYASRGAEAAKAEMLGVSAAGESVAVSSVAAGAGLVGIGAGIIALGVHAVNTASQFQFTMQTVRAKLDNIGDGTKMTNQQFDAMSQKALQLGRDTIFGATDAATAMLYLVRAGDSVKDIIDTDTQAVLNFAGATDTSIPTAANIFATTMNQFKDQGLSSTQIVDDLTVGILKSGQSASEFQTGFQMIGKIADSMGIPLAEVVGTMSWLTRVTGDSSLASTGLRSELTKIISPGKELGGIFASVGFNAYDTNGKFIGLGAVADELKDKFGGLSDQEQQHIAHLIGGARGMGVVLAMMKEGGGQIDQYTGEVGKAGSAQEIMSEKMDSLAGAAHRLAGSFNSVMVIVGTVMLPTAQLLVQGITMLLNLFISLPAPIQKFLVVLTMLGAAFLTVAGVVTLLGPAWAFLGPLMAAGAAIAGDLALSLAAVALPVTILVGAAWLLYEAWNANIGLQSALKTALDILLTPFQPLIDAVGRLTDGWNTFKDVFAGTQANDPKNWGWGQLATDIDALGNAIKYVFGKSALTDWLNKLAIDVEFAKWLFKWLEMEGVHPLAAGLESFGYLIGASGMPGLGSFIAKTGRALQDGINNFNAFRALGATPFVATMRGLARFFDTEGSPALTKFFDTLANHDWGGALSQIGDGIAAAFGGIGGFEHDLGMVTLSVAGFIITGLDSLYETLKQKILGAVGGNDATPGNGGSHGAASVTNAGGIPLGTVAVAVGGFIVHGLETAMSDITDKIKSALGIGGGPAGGGSIAGGGGIGGTSGAAAIGTSGIPLGQVAVSIGGFLVNGVETLGTYVIGKIASAWGVIRTTTTTLVDKVIHLGSFLVNAAISLGTDVISGIAKAWPTVRDAVTTVFGKAMTVGSFLVNAAKTIGTDVISAIAFAWPTVRDAATTLYGKIIDIGSWEVGQAKGTDLLKNIGDIVHGLTDGWSFNFTNWGIDVKTPSGKDIKVDGPGIIKNVNDATNTAIDKSANSNTYGTSQDAGKKVGMAAGPAIFAGVVAGIVIAWEGMKSAKAAAGLGARFVVGFVEGLAIDMYKGVLQLGAYLTPVTNGLVSQFGHWVGGIAGKLEGAIPGASGAGSFAGMLNTISQGTNGAGIRLHNYIVSTVTGWFDSVTQTDWTGALKDKLDAVVQPIKDFFSGIGEKIASIIGFGGDGGGGSGADSPSHGSYSITSNPLVQALSGLFNVSASDIPLPDWVTSPETTILKPFYDLIDKFGTLVTNLKDAWNKLQFWKDGTPESGTGGWITGAGFNPNGGPASASDGTSGPIIQPGQPGGPTDVQPVPNTARPQITFMSPRGLGSELGGGFDSSRNPAPVVIPAPNLSAFTSGMANMARIGTSSAQQLARNVQVGMQSLGPAVQGAVSSAIAGVQRMSTAFGSSGVQIAGVLTRMSGAFQNTSSDVGSMLAGLQSKISSFATTVTNAINELGRQVADGLKKGFNEGEKAALDAIHSIENALTSIPDPYDAGKGVGGRLGDGIAAGIASTVDSIKNAAAAAVQAGIDAARNQAVIKSPSKPMFDIGVNMGSSVGLGMSTTAETNAWHAARTISAAIAGAKKAFLKDIVGLHDVSRAVNAFQGNKTPTVLEKDANGIERIARQLETTHHLTAEQTAELKALSRDLKSYHGDHTPKQIVTAALGLDRVISKLIQDNPASAIKGVYDKFDKALTSPVGKHGGAMSNGWEDIGGGRFLSASGKIRKGIKLANGNWVDPDYMNALASDPGGADSILSLLDANGLNLDPTTGSHGKTKLPKSSTKTTTTSGSTTGSSSGSSGSGKTFNQTFNIHLDLSNVKGLMEAVKFIEALPGARVVVRGT